MKNSKSILKGMQIYLISSKTFFMKDCWAVSGRKGYRMCQEWTPRVLIVFKLVPFCSFHCKKNIYGRELRVAFNLHFPCRLSWTSLLEKYNLFVHLRNDLAQTMKQNKKNLIQVVHWTTIIFGWPERQCFHCY